MTNNAVQKFSDNYGQFEDGNQMSFPDFQKYIDENYSESNISLAQDLIPKMKESIVTSFRAAEKWLFKENRKSQFELFGYDFIIDEDFEVWLIEINTNPCLEESSKLLSHLIPRMIDDAFKLTLDVNFRKKGEKSKQNTDDKTNAETESKPTEFPVDNHDDLENMWELIL